LICSSGGVSIWYLLSLESIIQQIKRQYIKIDLQICNNKFSSIHRALLNRRERHIPGWHELQWSDVENVRRYYLPWEEERLILDLVNQFEKNLSKAIAYCE